MFKSYDAIRSANYNVCCPHGGAVEPSCLLGPTLNFVFDSLRTKSSDNNDGRYA